MTTLCQHLFKTQKKIIGGLTGYGDQSLSIVKLFVNTINDRVGTRQLQWLIATLRSYQLKLNIVNINFRLSLC